MVPLQINCQNNLCFIYLLKVAWKRYLKTRILRINIFELPIGNKWNMNIVIDIMFNSYLSHNESMITNGF
jgi:hypothetical protein